MSLPRDITPDPAEARRRRAEDPLLSSVVRADDLAHDSDCPDAEWLVAFSEGRVTLTERQSLGMHLQACERCQEIMAAFARASVGAPAEPDLVPWRGESALPAAPSAGWAGWLAGWRWMVPATSLVAVLVTAVWIGRGPADEAATGTTRREASPASMDARPSAPAPPPSATAPIDARPTATAPALSTMAAADAQGPAGAAGRDIPERMEEALQMRKAVAESRPEPPAAAGPATREKAAASQEALADARTESATAPPPPPAMAPAPAAVSPDRAGGNDASMFRSAIVASSWRTIRGRVEHSPDQGQSWRPVPVPGNPVIVAVAAVSPTTCWAISYEAIFRTVDGTEWVAVSRPPDGALTSISATSARQATVAAGGARFTTADGGATWSPAR